MTSLAMTNDGVSSNRFHSPAGGDLLRPSGDPGAPVRLRANLRRRAFVRACAHRNTLLESAAFGLHSSPSARRAGPRAGQMPRRNRQGATAHDHRQDTDILIRHPS
jgi:hypothetical protein